MSLCYKQPITSFSGDHFFLSNMYPCVVVDGDFQFPSSEHAYIFSKYGYDEEQISWLNAMDPKQAKVICRADDPVDGWDIDRFGVMLRLVRIKFSDFDLAAKLVATDGSLLVEGNTWHGTYWGQCPLGRGQNNLGLILMKVRDELIYSS